MNHNSIDADAMYHGFTARQLFLAAAGVATEDGDPMVAASAGAMRVRFTGRGTPRLTAAEAAAFSEVVEAAAEYEDGMLDVAVAEYDRDEEERLCAALPYYADDLCQILEYLAS